MQPVQDLTVDARVARTQYQYTLEDPDLDELNTLAPKLVESLMLTPELRDVSSDQQDRGLQLSVEFDRSTASRLGITPQMIDDALYDAFGQRQVSTIFTQLNQYRVVLAVKPDFQKMLGGAAIYLSSRHKRRAGTSWVSGQNRGDHRTACYQPPGSVSRYDDLLQSGAWSCPGTCRNGHRIRREKDGLPRQHQGQLSGDCPGVQGLP